MLMTLMAVAPAVAVGLTIAFHRTSRVNPGGMSSFHVRMVFPATTVRPGVAAAQPDGVIVQPEQGSSNPMLAPQGFKSPGTVSQMCTSHQVFVGDRFLTKMS